MTGISFRHTTAIVALGAALWTAGATTARVSARADVPPAASPALRHQFINNLDAKRNPPDARGYVSVTFPAPLPASPTVILQCANPRYSVKVHGATPTGFLFAVYRTKELLEGGGVDPFNGAGAAKPVTEFRDAENIDVAWVAIAGG